MKKFDTKSVNDKLINIPDYWDTDKVINAFDKFDTFELYDYFNCSNSTSFTRMMKPVFPNRPEKMSYSKYVRSLLVSSVKWKPGQPDTTHDTQEY